MLTDAAAPKIDQRRPEITNLAIEETPHVES